MKNRYLILLSLILLLAVFFTPIFNQFVREVIVIPFLYLLWIGRFLLEAVPQTILWGGFSVILMMIMVISLFGKSRPMVQLYKKTPAAQGRIAPWVELIKKAERDAYFKWRLAQGLQKLALDAIAHQSDQSLKETRQQLKQGELNLPPEIQAYFQASLKSLGYLSPSRRLFSSKAAASPLDLDPAQVAQFLENLMAESITPAKRRPYDS